jgi:hypothetical protein
MGICRVEFTFALGNPSIEEILLTIWREQKLQVYVSVPKAGNVNQKLDKDEFIYEIKHPKSNELMGRFSSKYKAIYLFKTIVENESFIIIISEPKCPELMRVVAHALTRLGGEEGSN